MAAIIALYLNVAQHVPALILAGCTSSTLPKLGDLMGEQENARVASTPLPGAPGAPVMTAATPRDRPLEAPPNPPLVGTDAPPAPSARAARGGDMIVAFKGPTIVLFGTEAGDNGERVATSSLSLPLQMKYASSSATRVQIETPYGPRWVSRSEIMLGSDGAAFPRR